jgi:trans-aconitate 2-methyltransferase
MTTTAWDPRQYERFASERGRPFQELVARIPTTDPVAVVDLGCGPGTMTATLARRWPSAAILGLDSSPEMIEAAQAHATEQLTFRLGDISAWTPEPGSVDVILANAAFQWVPEHAALLLRLAAGLDAGGALAFQVPVAGLMAATEIMRGLAAEEPWRGRLAAIESSTGPRGVSPVLAPEQYVDLLAGAGLAVDVWETTYYHVLTGPDPVLEWFAGTGLRPYLRALAPDETAVEAFRAEIAGRLRAAYPVHPYGTVLPFPRLFVVATKETRR